jgi:hypothetical protein
MLNCRKTAVENLFNNPLTIMAQDSLKLKFQLSESDECDGFLSVD